MLCYKWEQEIYLSKLVRRSTLLLVQNSIFPADRYTGQWKVSLKHGVGRYQLADGAGLSTGWLWHLLGRTFPAKMIRHSRAIPVLRQPSTMDQAMAGSNVAMLIPWNPAWSDVDTCWCGPTPQGKGAESFVNPTMPLCQVKSTLDTMWMVRRSSPVAGLAVWFWQLTIYGWRWSHPHDNRFNNV